MSPLTYLQIRFLRAMIRKASYASDLIELSKVFAYLESQAIDCDPRFFPKDVRQKMGDFREELSQHGMLIC